MNLYMLARKNKKQEELNDYEVFLCPLLYNQKQDNFFGDYVWFWLGEGSLLPWKGNLEQTPLNRCQPLPAPYKRLIHDINITNEPNRTT